MKPILQRSPILPVLVAIFLTVSLFAANAQTLEWKQLPIPLALCVAWSLVLWGCFWLVPVTRKQAASVTSLWVIVTLLWASIPEIPGKAIILAWLVPVLMITIGEMFIALRPKWVNKALPALSVVLSIAIVVSMGMSTIKIAAWQGGKAVQASPLVADKNLPDVYFIVPDRFNSIQGIEESGLDCSNFVAELESRGFYVQPDKMSDDPQLPGQTLISRTLRYLSSVLNLGRDVDSLSYADIAKGIRYSEVGKELKAMGYKYYQIGSWYPESAMSPLADQNYVYKGYSLMGNLYSDLFSGAVIDRSILRSTSFGQFASPLEQVKNEQGRHLFVRDSFKDIASNQPSPKFTFVHLTLPHQPFVWAADGSIPDTKDKTQMELYLGQVQFTEGCLLQMVDLIKNPCAIIIVQADEGNIFPNSKKETLTLSHVQYDGVLSAWKIPGADTSQLSSINTRDILKYVMGLVK